MWSRVLRRLLPLAPSFALFLCIAPGVRARGRPRITITQENSLPRQAPAERGAHSSDRSTSPPRASANQGLRRRRGIRFRCSSPTSSAAPRGLGRPVGESCSSNTSRTSADRICWNLLTGIPLTLNQNVEIPTGSSCPASNAHYPNASASICGTVDLSTVSVNFLTSSDKSRPPPTKTVSGADRHDRTRRADRARALPGNTRLVMNWDNISGEGGVSVLTSVQVFCDENHAGEIPTCRSARISSRSEGESAHGERRRYHQGRGHELRTRARMWTPGPPPPSWRTADASTSRRRRQYRHRHVHSGAAVTSTGRPPAPAARASTNLDRASPTTAGFSAAR